MNHIHLFILSLFTFFNTSDSFGQVDNWQATSTYIKMPVFGDVDMNQIVKLNITSDKNVNVKGKNTVESIEVNFDGSTDLKDILKVEIYTTDSSTFENPVLFGSSNEIKEQLEVKGNQTLTSKDLHFWLTIDVKDEIKLTNKIKANISKINMTDGSIKHIKNSDPDYIHRAGIAVRRKFDDNVDTYRIPGLATSNNGTLIAVYDIRYNRSKDLQENIDIGMSRSTDGGQTWEAMKIIMDMGTYNGLSEEENGIGDPAVLVDRKTGTIWAAALWMHGKKGQSAWAGSEAGMSIEKTGQFMLAKSDDDGLTWSDPINITSQIKDPEWNLFLDGPGKGITMKDGTLVFAAQYKDHNAIPHSTIIYSKDRGETWKVGTGAKSETTEAQVVELSDGSLMLNMRDNRNAISRKELLNGRSVFITRDMGETWIEHPSSRRALNESVCMGSLIATEVNGKNILFFSNPNRPNSRTNITIQTSFDEGKTWPIENKINLHENQSYGYSCLTRVDDDHIGILYEGIGDMYYQIVPIADLIGKK
ncbi:sialidase family protein [Portibacter lacus]|uniref:exo-alpha-sialidase n=1 Tax=Portibacter lacus TaxID=1099794 RepID=A0AA37SL64_9BACT|nr:sialidase family protein [Portibacter lacus]GLR15977.1 sialidase [Portibacter lacus]